MGATGMRRRTIGKEIAERVEKLRRKYGLGSRPDRTGTQSWQSPQLPLGFATEDRHGAGSKSERRGKRLRAAARAGETSKDAASSEVMQAGARSETAEPSPMLTMLFALACLAAFMAGRPPVSAAGSVRGRDLAPEAGNGESLRHDNARSFLRGAPRQRKASAQKIEKGARARAAIGFLLADPKQKNEKPENI